MDCDSLRANVFDDKNVRVVPVSAFGTNFQLADGFGGNTLLMLDKDDSGYNAGYK